MESGHSAVGEHSLRDHEVECSNPAGCWAAFYFFHSLSDFSKILNQRVFLARSLKEVHFYEISEKPGAKQA